MTPVATILLAAALGFGYMTGFHGSGSMVATLVSSRALAPYWALALTGAAAFCGPFLFGVAVAETIGKDIAPPAAITPSVILAALLAAIVWKLTTWWFGVPCSSSHALVGGLVGAVGVGHGVHLIQTSGLTKVIVALLGSPVLGLSIGWVLMRAILFGVCLLELSPRVNWLFKRGQLVTAVALALSQGTNEAQKTMAMIVMGLVSTGYMDTFRVPIWVVAASASVMALGIATGSWRIIRTLGYGIYRIRAVHGFTAQATAAGVILSAALLGGPVSTTQVASSAIMGVGSAERVGKVRWSAVENILLAWIFTLPASVLLAAALVEPIHQMLG